MDAMHFSVDFLHFKFYIFVHFEYVVLLGFDHILTKFHYTVRTFLNTVS